MDPGRAENVRYVAPSRGISTVELAWAAGFFDGEGHTHFTSGTDHRGGRPYIGMALTVSQATDDPETLLPPEVLDRFQRALLGLGKIYGPYRNRANKPMWQYRVYGLEGTQAAIALMWKYLSGPKRRQAATVLRDRKRVA